MSVQLITPCLWFDDQAEAAVEFYCSIFPNSKVLKVARYGEVGPGTPGSVMTVEFQLDGQKLLALNGGPIFQFTEAVSFIVDCQTQQEVDYYWQKLSTGGQEVQCGWLKDQFGLSWQVNPRRLVELISDPDPARSQRVVKAMLGMVKLDISALERAADGN